MGDHTIILYTLTYAITPLNEWCYFTYITFVLAERNQFLVKIVTIRVDVSVYVDMSIPKGFKFAYEY